MAICDCGIILDQGKNLCRSCERDRAKTVGQASAFLQFPFEELEAVIGYNWDSEEKDYERHVEENGDGTGHVFEHLKKLQEWLTKTKPKN